MRYWVYIHTCKANGKKYVGCTTRVKPELRWREGNGYQCNKYFYSAIQKYGWNNFEHEAWELTCKSEMYYAEKYLIAYYHTTESEFGYNHTAGGPLGSKKTGPKKPVSEETREKLRNASFHKDPEYREKLSEANRKKWTDPEYRRKLFEARKGQIRSEESRHRIAEANRRKANDPERLRKIAEAAKKRYSDPEVRKKMSETAKKVHSDPEFRRKISEANRKRWADPEYREKILEAAKNRPKIKIKLPDGTIVEITKSLLTRWYINRGKNFEYAD